MELTSALKIRFIDCDPLGHLNNAAYINYFMNALEDQIQEHYQMNFGDIARELGGSMVAICNQIAYLREVFPNQMLTFTSGIIAIREKTAVMEMRMTDARGKVCALLWTEFIWMDLETRRAVDIPEKTLDLLRDNFTPVEENDFMQRRNHFLKYNKELS